MTQEEQATLEARMVKLEQTVSQAVARMTTTEQSIVEIANSMLAASLEANCTAENALKTLEETQEKVLEMLRRLHDESEPEKTPQIM